MEYPEIRTATEFCLLVENVLGWVPVHGDGTPQWKVYAAEAGKVNRKIKSNPKLYTWANCLLAVEWLRRRKQTPTSPAAVLWSVERALKDAAAPVSATEIDQLLETALRVEMSERRPGWDEWVSRLTRATGVAREAVYLDWKATRA